MSSFFPRGLEEYVNWFRTFIAVAEANMGTLNVDQAKIDEWKVLLDELEAAMNAVELTKSAARQAVKDKDKKWDETIEVVGEYNGIFQNDKKIPQSLIEALGLRVHDTTPSHEVPFQPTGFTVKGLDIGKNRMNWNRNGNKSGTGYTIEVKYALDGEFQVVDTVTATKYDHQKQTPGVPAWYRITPRRGKLVGDPSETVAVYN
jgi:hypothetical protein